MTTMDQARKLYGRLAPRERFALVLAAVQRGDKEEAEALKHAAPRKNWAVVDTYGIANGFNHVAMFYMMNQLGDLLSMYWMMVGAKGEDGEKVITFTHEGEEIKISFDDYFDRMARRMLSNHMAWLKLCKEYKVDSNVMLEALPGSEIMQLCLALTDGAAGITESPEAQPTDLSIELAYQNMKGELEKLIADWE